MAYKKEMNAKQFSALLQAKPNKAIYYLYRKSSHIKNWIKANNGSNTEADDILQDGITILYKNLITAKTSLSTAPENYLMGICKNLWLTELRKQKKINTASLEILQDDIVLIEISDDSKNLNQLPFILNQIGAKCSRLLKLFYFEKQNMEVIAKKLNFRNDKVAKAMKYKCLIKARKIIFENQ